VVELALEEMCGDERFIGERVIEVVKLKRKVLV